MKRGKKFVQGKKRDVKEKTKLTNLMDMSVSLSLQVRNKKNEK